ncbi:uncharacterized protein EI97DRAFT_270602 [Westerdykella ornata]|uniref:Uncharacterized protein n=1 Tax=Westerdykella ornata TaxID=318751 RepID=A0A6A6JN92_WESOR|nr:uncharacterized protein EI97DRAFT_270602 [Westerdykella ornata]KAF2277695.1 hypothetical protein EI97DRAFT_270602 [Westerdykella ornata]
MATPLQRQQQAQATGANGAQPGARGFAMPHLPLHGQQRYTFQHTVLQPPAPPQQQRSYQLAQTQPQINTQINPQLQAPVPTQMQIGALQQRQQPQQQQWSQQQQQWRQQLLRLQQQQRRRQQQRLHQQPPQQPLQQAPLQPAQAQHAQQQAYYRYMQQRQQQQQQVFLQPPQQQQSQQQAFQQPPQQQQSQQQTQQCPPPQRPQSAPSAASAQIPTQTRTASTTHRYVPATPHNPNEPRILLRIHEGRPTTIIHDLWIPPRDPLGPHLLQLCESQDLLFRFDWNFVYWHPSPLPTDPDNTIPIVLRWTDTPGGVQIPGSQGGVVPLEHGCKVDMVSWIRDAKFVEQKGLELGLEDWEKVYVVTTMQKCRRGLRIERLQEQQEMNNWISELQVKTLTMAQRLSAAEVELAWLKEAYQIVVGEKKGLEERLRVAEMMERTLRSWIREHGGLDGQTADPVVLSAPAPAPGLAPVQDPVEPPVQTPVTAFQALVRPAVQAQAEEEAKAHPPRPTVESVHDSGDDSRSQSREDGRGHGQENAVADEVGDGSEKGSEDGSADEMDN